MIRVDCGTMRIVSSTDNTLAAVTAAAADAGFRLDPEQTRLLHKLAELGAGADRRRFRSARRRRGLYVHGAAGRGKSWLVDAFHATLPAHRTTRVHFHSFFDELHREIHSVRGDPHPVDAAIHAVTGTTTFLFFDELHVHDSGDARLLTRLLDRAFAHGQIVIATSNYAPAQLLPNPIWHHTIERGIELIRSHMDIHHLAGSVDYRSTTSDHSHGFAAGTWTSRAESGAPRSGSTELRQGDRRFPVVSAGATHLFATFAQLCETPVSTIEYLEWSRRFDHWTITDIPLFRNADPEAQQRFINMVDILVDADVRATFVSRNSLSEFIDSASLRPDAFRMASRLQLLRDAHRRGQ